MSKNIIIKQFNNNTFEELFPKTISSQVDGLQDTISSLIGSQGFCKIELGSYIGTGTYGSNNWNSISFNFIPKVVFALGYFIEATSSSHIIIGRDLTETAMVPDLTPEQFTKELGFSLGPNTNYTYGRRSPDKKTLYWYGTENAGQQLNNLDFVYYFMALV